MCTACSVYNKYIYSIGALQTAVEVLSVHFRPRNYVPMGYYLLQSRTFAYRSEVMSSYACVVC